jgi:hypothetical protein
MSRFIDTTTTMSRADDCRADLLTDDLDDDDFHLLHLMSRRNLLTSFIVFLSPTDLFR